MRNRCLGKFNHSASFEEFWTTVVDDVKATYKKIWDECNAKAISDVLCHCQMCGRSDIPYPEMDRVNSGDNRGRCRKCLSDVVTRRKMKMRALKEPNMYMECLDCCKHFRKYKNPNSSYLKENLRTECPYCDSLNFKLYSEVLKDEDE